MPLPDISSSDPQPTASGHFEARLGQTGRLKIAIPLLVLCLVLGFLYREGIDWLLEVWSHNDYSHGYLVPLISLYLIWEQRERFRMLPVEPNYPAAAIIILACMVLLLVSRNSAVIQLEAVSLFLIIPGMLLLLFGWQVTRASLLPWLYLSFMLPWFDLFLERFQPSFQQITAILGSKLLSLVYPVFLDDTYIHLPSISMVVARECSGVNFFISVLAIGIPLVYLTQRGWIRAVVVLAFGLIITMLANGVRVAIAGILGENFGVALLHGPSHILQGWFVAWVGWVGIFVVNWLVVRKTTITGPKLCERWMSRPKVVGQNQQRLGIASRQIYIAILLISLCTIGIYFASPSPVSLPLPLEKLPNMLINWKGTDTEGSGWSAFFQGADDQIGRVYRSTRYNDSIYLYIAYFNKQSERKRLVSKFSKPMHIHAKEIDLHHLVAEGIPQKVNRTTLEQNGIFYDVFFWYQFRDGKTVTTRNRARLMALENGILHRQNDGAAVLIAVRKDSGKDTKNSLDIPEAISAFLKDAGSEINRFLP